MIHATHAPDMNSQSSQNSLFSALRHTSIIPCSAVLASCQTSVAKKDDYASLGKPLFVD